MTSGLQVEVLKSAAARRYWAPSPGMTEKMDDNTKTSLWNTLELAPMGLPLTVCSLPFDRPKQLSRCLAALERLVLRDQLFQDLARLVLRAGRVQRIGQMVLHVLV
jgi:hypothetical protein